ncbi:ABC transporter ATP-binding protein [Aerococcus urinae]|uniref:ABC transporter ATP-binding protein n=1 Tax=Aerococcus urinae TaxID=1376 RepID=UPI00227A2833|nr:ABC transporter ATP-binding protein [Aerococcus urinae]MCY3046261.1 ABC transporter ATP-binding protein [Aerococcus urinae]
MLLNVIHLEKIYGQGGNATTALRDVTFQEEAGEFVAIMGESGSGKSTLLNIIATLDKATGGQVFLNGQSLAALGESDLAAFRRKELGFVFQDFNMLNTFTNRDNILLPLVLSNMDYPEMERRLAKIAPLLGIEDLLDKYPYQISGGQQQRVAIGRAIITQPSLILADEPTGALDSKNSEAIMKLFTQLNQQGMTIFMVTHSLRCAAYAKRVLFIKDGVVYHEIYRGEDSLADFQEKIANSLSFLNREEG